MKRLSEELKKDYNQMKTNKWKMSDVVSKWWESMIGQQKLRKKGGKNEMNNFEFLKYFYFTI